ncbi:hypothetical protein BRADI_4g07335v3 [Brachypodium distachyon]|uniref:Uncharacterized protein n=1 Tax=Brachypodium distachyon TaxID=15368 RepID=A0A2K2CL05_BRADI|nr:hypothetical protein BRADI_4g07335v3 [Brachypodium distachyon]
MLRFGFGSKKRGEKGESKVEGVPGGTSGSTRKKRRTPTHRHRQATEEIAALVCPGLLPLLSPASTTLSNACSNTSSTKSW